MYDLVKWWYNSEAFLFVSSEDFRCNRKVFNTRIVYCLNFILENALYYKCMYLNIETPDLRAAHDLCKSCLFRLIFFFALLPINLFNFFSTSYCEFSLLVLVHIEGIKSEFMNDRLQRLYKTPSVRYPRPPKRFS